MLTFAFALCLATYLLLVGCLLAACLLLACRLTLVCCLLPACCLLLAAGLQRLAACSTPKREQPPPPAINHASTRVAQHSSVAPRQLALSELLFGGGLPALAGPAFVCCFGLLPMRVALSFLTCLLLRLRCFFLSALLAAFTSSFFTFCAWAPRDPVSHTDHKVP
jgi:hypothetical protein